MTFNFQYLLNKLLNISGFDTFKWQSTILFIGVVVAVFVIELAFVGWKNSALKKVLQFNKSVRTDFTFWLLEVFNLYNIIAFTISLGACYYLVGLIQKTVHFNLGEFINNPHLQFALIFLIADLKNYVRHRVFHNIKPLWQLHAFHHSATSFSILTRYRGHFLEVSIARFFDVIPFILMGAPIQTYIAVKILVEVHQLLIHSNFTSNWGVVGKFVVVSPAAHRIHHSIEPKHFNKNYGNTFIFWDRLFGSYHQPEEVVELGIPDNTYNKKSVVADLWKTLINFVNSFIPSKAG
jgi:sterol desaturase/sphingolipid hydroxylase (fatty acid hydroxylase superfamily)